MRTTLKLDPDVVAAVEQRRRETGAGLSEAVNELARAGLVAAERDREYVHHVDDVGLRVDVTDVGAVLDLLDESGT